MEPLIARGKHDRAGCEGPINARGEALVIQEWEGSGPAHLHVHHRDDEAWHVLEGTLRFKFADKEVDAHAGTTVFVPAGVVHTFEALDESRYLMILTPRLFHLIEELHTTPLDRHGEVMRQYQSEIIEEASEETAAAPGS